MLFFQWKVSIPTFTLTDLFSLSLFSSLLFSQQKRKEKNAGEERIEENGRNERRKMRNFQSAKNGKQEGKNPFIRF